MYINTFFFWKSRSVLEKSSKKEHHLKNFNQTMMLKKLKVLRNISSKPNSLFQLPNLTQSLVECTRVHPLSQEKKQSFHI